MLLMGGPFIEPGLQMIEVVASCFFEIGEVDGIIDMRQGIKITEANLYRIPARKIITHRIIALSFLLHALFDLHSTRTCSLKTIAPGFPQANVMDSHLAP